MTYAFAFMLIAFHLPVHGCRARSVNRPLTSKMCTLCVRVCL